MKNMDLLERLEKAGDLQHAYNLASKGDGIRFMQEEPWNLTEEDISNIYLASEGKMSFQDMLPPGMKTPMQRFLAWRILSPEKVS